MPPELRSVGLARAKLTELAQVWGTPADVLDDARVVLSELMSNGVLHARTELEVVMNQRGTGLRLEVHDASPVPLLTPWRLSAANQRCSSPAQELADADSLDAPAATGRGLSMVAALVTTWGWFSDASGGKVVWAEVGTPGAADGPGGALPRASLPSRSVPSASSLCPFGCSKRPKTISTTSSGSCRWPTWPARGRCEPAEAGNAGAAWQPTVAALALLAETVKGPLGPYA